jgi:hypothetical protein
MQAATIKAIVMAGAELARAGVPIFKAIQEARDNGEVSEQTWAEINDNVNTAANEWDQKYER